MPKSVVKPMNSNKNKLNNEIILIFHFNPNAHLVLVWIACFALSSAPAFHFYRPIGIVHETRNLEKMQI